MSGQRTDTALNTITVNIKHFSYYQILGIDLSDFDNINIYPQPAKTGTVTFNNIPLGCRLKVYDISGQQVGGETEDSGNTGRIQWNIPPGISQGIYVYILNHDKGKKKGRIAIIK